MSKETTGASAFWGCMDLASADIGGRALLCSDEFFAEMHNLLKPEPAVFLPDEYTDRGKWMDGWEPRRKRVPGHDWCIIELGAPGRVVGIDIDTSHFTGNHPPFASLDGVWAPGASAEDLRDSVDWLPLLGQIGLKRGSQNLASSESEEPCTHVRLNIYPAGGVARLRVYGEPRGAVGDPALAEDGLVDLAALAYGGRALACSDSYFSPMNNLLLPQRAEHMGQGWETRRSRPPGDDWVIIRLGQPGSIERVLIDTNHFKGNYPDRLALDALYWPGAPPHALTRGPEWTEILPLSKLAAHEERSFELGTEGPWTHVRMRIVPDGGVSRLRIFGRPSETAPGESDPLLQYLNGLTSDAAKQVLQRCCGSSRWAARMASRRPFGGRAELFGEAEQIWWHLGDGDWLEAFAHHPEIGADPEALRARFGAAAAWSESEQAGVAGASEATLAELAEANRAYRDHYGFVFLICASGLSAETMLSALRDRMGGESWAELRIAAGEQAKITRLRLEKITASAS